MGGSGSYGGGGYSGGSSGGSGGFSPFTASGGGAGGSMTAGGGGMMTTGGGGGITGGQPSQTTYVVSPAKECRVEQTCRERCGSNYQIGEAGRDGCGSCICVQPAVTYSK